MRNVHDIIQNQVHVDNVCVENKHCIYKRSLYNIIIIIIIINNNIIIIIISWHMYVNQHFLASQNSYFPNITKHK